MSSKESYSWEVRKSPYPSPFIKKSHKFGDTEFVYLIDQFCGKQPFLLNKEIKKKGTLKVSFHPSAALDSNLVDALDSYVRRGKATDSFKLFAKFLARNRWDVSPFFYLLEHMSKETTDVFRENAVRRMESLLKFHSMDEDYFVDTGVVRESEDMEAKYLEPEGVRSLGELSAKRVEEFIKLYYQMEFKNSIEATRIALIRMVLIRRRDLPRASIAEQCDSLADFLESNFDIVLARELILGFHYFSDQAGKLLGIMKNTDKEKAKSIVRSTSWDLWFTRLPEYFLSSSPHEVSVVYIATEERKLYDFSKLHTIERVLGDLDGGKFPQVSYAMDEIPKSVIAKLPKNFSLGNNSRAEPNEPTQWRGLPSGLLEKMEAELEEFCS